MGRLITYKDLNKRITFIEKANVKNSYGEIQTTNRVYHSCWASVKEQGIAESKKNIGTVLEDTITIIIRYQQTKKIDNEHLIQFNYKFYEIVKLNKDDVNKEFISMIAKRIE